MPRRICFLAVAPAFFAACGGGDGPATQRMPSETAFQRGNFDDLPLHPRSEPLGVKTETDGVSTRYSLSLEPR
ncbi:MAG TPA: hypothetical protein VM938_15480 [Acidimicrobiales bacterium]|nr:hypothetical protein [Acidimicrobiales bacterium]